MKTQVSRKKTNLKRLKSKMGAVALFAIVTLLFAPAVYADMAADTEILNVVTVTYYDASGTYDFSVTAAATVTVSLVQSELTISGRPTNGQPGDSADLPSDQNLQSGDTWSYLYAITSNANGDDSYTISISNTLTGTLTNPTVTTQIVAPDGSSFLQDSTDPLTLGASVIVGVAGTTLSFPGGTLTGITAGDVVVIDNVDYLVGPITYGNTASYDAGTGATTPETRATIQLLQNGNGSQADPASALFSIGTPIYEQALLLVEVSAFNTDVNDGSILVDIAADVTAEIGPTIDPVTVDDQTTTFAGLSLTIEKLVTNVDDGTFAATAQGVSGDTLEYQVTVTNTGGAAANVVVTDAVPDYTTLIDNAYSGNFADFSFTNSLGVSTPGTIAGGSSTAVDNPNLISGIAPGTAAQSSLTFYVGQGHDPADATSPGGTLLTNESVVIHYRVIID